MKRLFSGLFIALILPTLATAQTAHPIAGGRGGVDVARLPMQGIITTIAQVTLENGGTSATVFANNDIRSLRATNRDGVVIGDILEAKRNGLEVEIDVAEIPGDTAYAIVRFQIRSQDNKLTSGFNMPDRQFYPINVGSQRGLYNMFHSVYKYDANEYDVNDNCFNRAQFWSRHWQAQNAPAGTDKVFIFFTQAYQRKFGHKWWFHVAPVAYLNGDPWTLDPTFLDEPVSLGDWLATFDHFTHGQCQQISTIDEYYANNNQPNCYYIVTSMFNYTPSDLTNRPLTNWRCYDFNRLTSAIPNPGSKTESYVPWSQANINELMPDMCR